jgi:hypothetical protein
MSGDTLTPPKFLWGCKAIGAYAGGISAVTVRAWQRLPDCPIKKVNGRYCVAESLLLTWLTRKPALSVDSN